MKTKLMTVSAIAAAILILVPYGSGNVEQVRAQPAAAAVELAAVPVGRVIAAQGNAALVQIRADAVRITPPDPALYAVEGRQ